MRSMEEQRGFSALRPGRLVSTEREGRRQREKEARVCEIGTMPPCSAARCERSRTGRQGGTAFMAPSCAEDANAPTPVTVCAKDCKDAGHGTLGRDPIKAMWHVCLCVCGFRHATQLLRHKGIWKYNSISLLHITIVPFRWSQAWSLHWSPSLLPACCRSRKASIAAWRLLLKPPTDLGPRRARGRPMQGNPCVLRGG